VFPICQHGYFVVLAEIAHHEGCAAFGESQHSKLQEPRNITRDFWSVSEVFD
jgi:hypothetical protein